MDFLLNQNILLYLSAYILSSIPFGYILAKIFAGVDVKNEGSGNIGATNVIRVVKLKDPSLAKKLGIATFILDALKGVLILLIAMALDSTQSVLWTIAVLSVMGHCFSIFLSFEGGKGVATGFGVLATMMPIPAVIAISFWAITSKFVKISFLSAFVGVYSFVALSYAFYPIVDEIGSHAPIWIVALTISYKHIPNVMSYFQTQKSNS